MRSWLASIIVFAACSSPDHGAVKIIGHGGSGTGGEHPIDSREALLGGLDMGLNGVEMDVQLTADSVLVAFHDADLASAASCKGKINAHTWGELWSCPVIDGGKEYSIVRLDSLLREMATQHPSADFTFDCKLFAEGDWWAYMGVFAARIAALDSVTKGRILVECQVTDFLDVMHRAAPDVDTYFYPTTFEGAVDTALAHHCAGITIDNALITAEQVASAKSRGLRVTLFGVGGALDQHEALGKGPDRIQVDEL
ncbi:MAG TPA: glycerophosphodiester phosphodiesterase family protein [Flavobacteriales bacterium]|nr:glycerophosphodiester phosphodiesterase family protein [Flavobacteriales bacterium]